MTDRFKFRVWNKKVKKMYDVKSMSYINGVIKRIEVQGDIGIAIFDEYRKHIDNCILMQCTGLRDKNGKLIYEGDIVKFKTEMFGKPKQIIWNECHYILKDTFIILCDMKVKQFGLEVVGNIYENPELLEV